jgi:hypothetical protein
MEKERRKSKENMKRKRYDESKRKFKFPSRSSSRKNLYNTVTSTADDPSPILAPDNGTDTLPAH